ASSTGSVERTQEVLDLQRGQRLDARRAASAERDRHLRDRRRVGSLDDVDEVELAERGPLVQDPAAELLDVLIHLPEPLRIRLEGLHALLRQGRQEDVDRHRAAPWLVVAASLPGPPGRRTASPRPGTAAG